ncbi:MULTISPECIES: hypothetical protein [Actinomycetes]|uniref:hypothetical protein n=1 Tax=Actinomycetes TaxID=1760 RepID=UPI0026473949|nr:MULTISPECIES: hypothetical protein [Actinomycetes]MDN6618078.1 hypothetical protein [Corynebacterium variabile]MDN5980268.1 hypothetical protein [Bifidobacterium mongoliense]MDN6442159.1 hypothetical protein [Acidipropionibacterium jensenii]MDN6513899.1 hypothetical protein [Acidipropionibacterium jensenii]MDN6592030.1 hypothetical protein [Acidipropionibacterium jensenii]
MSDIFHPAPTGRTVMDLVRECGVIRARGFAIVTTHVCDADKATMWGRDDEPGFLAHLVMTAIDGRIPEAVQA